jgi:hypothetical protein
MKQNGFQYLIVVYTTGKVGGNLILRVIFCLKTWGPSKTSEEVISSTSLDSGTGGPASFSKFSFGSSADFDFSSSFVGSVSVLVSRVEISFLRDSSCPTGVASFPFSESGRLFKGKGSV